MRGVDAHDTWIFKLKLIQLLKYGVKHLTSGIHVWKFLLDISPTPHFQHLSLYRSTEDCTHIVTGSHSGSITKLQIPDYGSIAALGLMQPPHIIKCHVQWSTIISVTPWELTGKFPRTKSQVSLYESHHAHRQTLSCTMTSAQLDQWRSYPVGKDSW